MNATPNGVDVADVLKTNYSHDQHVMEAVRQPENTRAAGSQDAPIKALRARIAQLEDELRGLRQEGAG